VRYDLNLSITNLRDGDRVTEIPNTVFNLDLVVKKLLECGQIENLVADWLGAIDGVLYIHYQSSNRDAVKLEHTFLVTFAGLPFCTITICLAYCSSCQHFQGQ
jgi:hypothetical protein